ncbi:MAG TPA: DUF6178 family protein [Vicinamibacterales bacterium]|nr:DUF6178 family protein [Vicinamibacterales bacterium]
MSKHAAPRRLDRQPPESASALARLTDTPHLAQVVSRLSPELLHQLIRHHGIDACGPLVAAATPRQVTAILDLDLWRPAAAGGTEQFDVVRFGAWLEALMEEGDAVAARVIAEMDESLAVAGLSRYLRVFDPGIFEPTFSSDDEREWNGPTPSDDCECEIGGYLIRARTADAWDAIVGLLMTLSEDRPRAFHALMNGCRDLSNSTPEEDGLDDLLLAPEQALHDVGLEREQRRTQQGYLSAEDARAFLRVARQPARRGPSPSMNPIAAAYFRDLNEAMVSTDEPAPRDDRSAPAELPDAELAASLDVVAEVMAEAGIAPAQPRALLGPAEALGARITPLEPLMEHVLAAHHVAYLARNQELTFLANALLAGCSVHTRALTIQEAWDAVVGVCNIGLEGAQRPESYLVDHDLIAAFETGWRLLHEEVSLYVTDRLIGVLAELRTVDEDVQRDLERLRRELKRERDAGTPWRAAETLEVVAILDTPAWACLCGLLSECPVVPDALAAVLDHRAKALSATAFACFTTRTQIERVHEFGGRLRDLLL